MPLDLQGGIVPHLKDLIYICLETKAQGHGMILKAYVLAQITHISYHSEAIVRIEVGCTVIQLGVFWTAEGQKIFPRSQPLF